jgi:hypothetical protein
MAGADTAAALIMTLASALNLLGASREYASPQEPTVCQLGGGPPANAFSIPLDGAASVSIVVRDGRDDVVHGKNKETLVGHQRSLYGIPYPEDTPSGRTFAYELARLVAAGFNHDGVNLKAFTASPLQPLDAAIRPLVSTGADRLLLFNVSGTQTGMRERRCTTT